MGGGARAFCSAFIAKLAGSKDSPAGFTPHQLHKAYDLPSHAAGRTPPVIAIVNAFDAPTVQHDLNHYSTTFDIPGLPNCNGDIAKSKTPCFKKIDQRGGNDFPADDSAHFNASIEVEAAHAICQNCSILLVEADDNYSNNLFTAVDQAVLQKAGYVEDSWYGTGSEDKNIYQSFDGHFNHPGVLMVTAEPLGEYGTFSYPAASKYVTAVGATVLTLDQNDEYENETAWNVSGNYCDQYEKKPYWQNMTPCRKRMGADVSMVGVDFAVYDSTDDPPGWSEAFGISISAAMITAVFALAHDRQDDMSAIPYQKYSLDNFHDITNGSNGECKPKRLCTAMNGYDGPSGLGSPKGIGGF